MGMKIFLDTAMQKLQCFVLYNVSNTCPSEFNRTAMFMELKSTCLLPCSRGNLVDRIVTFKGVLQNRGRVQGCIIVES